MKHSVEFKKQVVEESKTERVSVLSKKYGLNPAMIYFWIKKYDPGRTSRTVKKLKEKPEKQEQILEDVPQNEVLNYEQTI